MWTPLTSNLRLVIADAGLYTCTVYRTMYMYMCNIIIYCTCSTHTHTHTHTHCHIHKHLLSHHSTLYVYLPSLSHPLSIQVDPLFKKTCASFDEGGVGGLLLNQLSVGSDDCLLMLDPNQVPPSEEGSIEHTPTSIPGLSELKGQWV